MAKKLKWSKRTSWATLGLAALAALVLSGLVATAAIETDWGIWGAALLFGLGVIAALMTLVATDDVPLTATTRTSWLKPRPISVLFLAIFCAFGLMTDALALFEPRPARESAPGAIEQGVARIEGHLRQLPKTAPAQPVILQKISGIWGEPGCEVTYRFRIENGAILVTFDRPPPGAEPFELEATIIRPVAGNVLYATGERPARARARAVAFRYESSGRTERLIWDDHDRPALRLDRCQGQHVSRG